MKTIPVLLICCLSGFLFAQTRTFKLPEIERREVNVFPINPASLAGDPLLISLGNRQTQNQAIQKYKQLGAQATPGLLKHLQDPQPGIRLLALSALQYAWAPGAENAVVPFLMSESDSEAQTAWYLLKQKTNPGEVEQWAEQNLLRLNSGRVAEMLDMLESERPDSERMMTLLQQPKYWKAALPYLPRYTDPVFTPVTRGIVGRASGQWRALALAALIHQTDRDPLVLNQVGGLLSDEDAVVREMAAEYLRWHGRTSDISTISTALEMETDLFARAAMTEAVRILGLRTQVDAPNPIRPMEPLVNYANDLSGDPALLVSQRLSALRVATGYGAIEKRQDEEEAPWTLVPPTRSFLAERGRGFGFGIKTEQGPFADSVHLAQDVSWGEVMATVVAVSPGTVKMVRIARESWGGLVVIEHQSPNGKTFCSLYGHLGPLITVQPGDQIAAGTKLGSLGRSYTAENGGYEVHLHFGIYNDVYGNGRWVNGYMEPDTFLLGDHKWIDPYSVYPE